MELNRIGLKKWLKKNRHNRMIVTNSGPLMALGKLGHLDLLGRLYEQVAMPAAVYDEVVVKGLTQGYLDSYQAQLAIQRKYLAVMEPNNLHPQVEHLPLHKGEREALNLALDNRSDLVLMDDMIAREHAQAFGLKVKGTLGIIVSAYRNKLLSLDEVQIIIETIIKRNDIWIAAGLCRSILTRLNKESK